MPMHWRRILDTTAFIVGVCVCVWAKYALGINWYQAIGIGLATFLLIPFIVSRVLAKIIIHRMERAIVKLEQQSRQ